ncbi:MAG TPA: di-trans,poly-cis-decaprenylcistransferase [Candidatus Moranbacteria bacterium]|nr:di-trans,poly-cis-decaprenylcistransferase [Candidatus Moranbacteria bacterium]
MIEDKNMKIPNHLAIIPDGNRRWAKERKLDPWEGHEAGAKNTEELIRYALERGINCLTLWGSSMDNLKKRPFQEKKALLDIYNRYFTKMLNNSDIDKQEARINFIGRWEEQFPESLKNILYAIIEKTKKYEKKMLNFMLAYNGDDDIIQAVQKIHSKCESRVKITANVLKQSLMTAELPAVDYLVRTGGDAHLSAGFMMWDVANAQLYFSDELFPDFNKEKLHDALEEYSRRQRRFGK